MSTRFFGSSAILFGLALFVFMLGSCMTGTSIQNDVSGRAYNGPYTGEYLNRVAFPVGGIGAGMFCLEGSGAVSHVSVRNTMEFFHEPCMFAALTVKGEENTARVLEGLREVFIYPLLLVEPGIWSGSAGVMRASRYSSSDQVSG